MNEKYIALLPCSGLCNRLRAIYSYYKLAKEQDKPFLIIWRSKIDSACIGNLLDYYEKIPDVDYILDDTKLDLTRELKLKYMDTYLIERNKGNYNTISSGGPVLENKKYSGKWTHLYKELNLKSEMLTLDEIQSKLRK